MHWQLIWPRAKAVSVADAEVVFFFPRHWPLSFFNHFALFRTVYDKFYKIRLFLLLWPKGPLDLRMINIFYQSNCLSQTWNRCQASPHALLVMQVVVSEYMTGYLHIFFIYIYLMYFSFRAGGEHTWTTTCPGSNAIGGLSGSPAWSTYRTCSHPNIKTKQREFFNC